MDATIQSLVQSPFIRTMSAIPSKSELLVHGVADHMPPLSRQFVRLFPFSNPGIAGKWRFDLPKLGYINRMELVVRPVKAVFDTITVNTLLGGINQNYAMPYNLFREAVTSVELYSKQRFIEQLLPEGIMEENRPHMHADEFSYIKTTLDVDPSDVSFNNVNLPFPYTAWGRHHIYHLDPNDSKCNNLQFHIPLPFASLSSLKKNFQSNFVENLSVFVTTKHWGLSVMSHYEMCLEVVYHNFHPNVETVLRNANYKQGIPATLPWHEYVRFDRVSRGSGAVDRIIVDLSSDAIISKLLVTPVRRSKVHTQGVVDTIVLRQNPYVVVSSLSEVLFEGSWQQCVDRDDVVLDEAEWRSLPYHQAPDCMPYIPINLGLKRDVERWTGGLALSSLVNPTLTIYANESVYRGASSGLDTEVFPGDSAEFGPLTFDVIGKRHFLLRIDSDTGVISRSIES